METLVNVDFRDGLVAGVPGNIEVAHKFGEREVDSQQTQLHDCGIVYYPKRPYLLCVMTRGQHTDDGAVDEQKLQAIIKEVSTIVYNYVEPSDREASTDKKDANTGIR